jgi:hypothetical protein
MVQLAGGCARDVNSHGVGGQRVWVMRDENNGGELMEIQFTCTEYAPPARLTSRTRTAGVFEGLSSYRLTALGNAKTHVEEDGQYQYSMWLARLMEPLITPQADKKMRSDLARLKQLVAERNRPPVTLRPSQ